MDVFDSIIAFVLKTEAGFQKDPTDPGNWTGGKIGVGTLVGTNCGISAASYPHEDIPHMTPTRARELFRRDFWLPIRGPELPFPLAVVVLDAAVNCGVGQAIRWLQRSVGVTADGALGPITMAAIRTANPVTVATRFTRKRIVGSSDFANWSGARDSWVQRSCDMLLVAAGVTV